MPPRVTRRAAGESSSDASAASAVGEQPREVFHIVENPTYADLSPGDKVICIGGWRREKLRGHRLEFICHVWNLNIGQQYIRCWWPRGHEVIHLRVTEYRKV